jgi:hypothetical protein
MLDGCTVRTTSGLLSLLQDARGLRCNHGLRCQSNTKRHKLFSPPVLYLVSRLLIHELSGGCIRWQLCHFVLINQQNGGYEPTWQELEYIYPFFPPTPPFSFPPIVNAPLAITHTASILNYLDITWLAQNNTWQSKTHLMTNTTFYVHSRRFPLHSTVS